eukprot:GHRR01015049.1.p2 GENE.GHRR01015049.1~~GHRR01015049.1.p2  ORF type:complete len:117 (+),score=58.21 GHRR01015049.1:1758-2108(+)
MDKVMAGCMAAVLELAATDVLVNEVLIRVMQMLDETSALLQPAVVGRVLLHKLATALTSRKAKQWSHNMFTILGIKPNPTVGSGGLTSSSDSSINSSSSSSTASKKCVSSSASVGR